MIKKALESTELFTTEELEKIKSFLDKGFNSPIAQICIASIFIEAKKSEKPVAEVVVACEKEWYGNWRSQHPDIRGNILAPGDAGKQNAESLWNVYDFLGIPKGWFEVKTKNSTYWFGRDEGGGIRSVSTDSCLPLLRHRCKITVLAVGKEMGFDYVPLNGRYRATSTVVSIIKPEEGPKEAKA